MQDARLVLSAIFLVWAFTRPLGEELAEAEADHTGPAGAPAPRGVDAAALGSHQRRRRTGDDRTGAGGGDDPGRE